MFKKEYTHTLSAWWGKMGHDIVSEISLNWSEKGLTLISRSWEPKVVISHMKDNSPLYEDSCIELFFSTDGGKNYYNFEMNAAGFLLIQYGQSRQGRSFIDPNSLEGLERRAILSSTSGGWSGELVIPPQLFAGLSPEHILGNVYKCGDETGHRHYLALFPISTGKPDFHQPNYFRPLPISIE